MMKWVPWRQFKQNLKNALGSIAMMEKSEGPTGTPGGHVPFHGGLVTTDVSVGINCFGSWAYCS